MEEEKEEKDEIIVGYRKYMSLNLFNQGTFFDT